MKIKSIRKAKNLFGKKVLLRADFNVPIKNGKILDEYKIIKQLPTIRFLLRHRCKIVILTHLGRPKTQKKEKEFSILLVANRISKMLGRNVKYVNDCVGFEAGTAVSKMKNGDIVFLENIRYEKGEEENSKILAKKLAKYADIYVNDAFAVSHRSHASLDAIKNYLDSYAGLLLESEVLNLNKALNPKKPLVVIIGGAKIKTKIALIKNIQKKASHILLGGALVNNFFVDRGYEVGKSLIDEESLKFARKFKNENIILPVDVVVSGSKNGESCEVKNIHQVNKKDYIFDIGPKTIRLYSSFIKKANTIIWNGPMGLFELKSFRTGTLSIARSIASRSTGKAFGVVGGGETVEALKMTKMMDHVDWVSTGGGATLTYLGGEKMPGLKDII